MNNEDRDDAAFDRATDDSAQLPDWYDVGSEDYGDDE